MKSKIFAAACGAIGEKKHIHSSNDKGGEQKPMIAWGIKFSRPPAAAWERENISAAAICWGKVIVRRGKIKISWGKARMRIGCGMVRVSWGRGRSELVGGKSELVGE